MSIGLKQAAEQALSALEKSQPHPSNPVIGLTNQDFIDHEETIRQLRTAIQQAEAQQVENSTATPEPVWFHKHWCDGDDIFYRPDDNIPSGSTPLYTHPSPRVPDDVVRDVERYRWLRKTRFIWSDFRYISGVHPTVVGLEFQWFPTQAQQPTREDLDVAIDAAMLAAKEPS